MAHDTHLPGVRSIARNTLFLTLAQAFGMAARAVYVVVVARLLGPEVYALLAYGQSWYLAFLPIALFGVGPVLVHRIAGQRSDAARIAGEALGLRAATTLLACVLCVAGAWWASPDSRASELISVFAFALAGRAITAWSHHLFTAFEAGDFLLRQELVFRVLEVAAAIGILLAGGDVIALAATNGVIWWLQAIVSIVIVRRKLTRTRPIFDLARWLELARLATPFAIMLVAVDWRWFGSLILYRNLIDDPAAFGQFALAMQAFFILGLAPVSLMTAAQPVVTRSAARGDGKDLLFAGLMHRGGVLLGTAIALPGMVLGPPVFRLVFGEAYETAGYIAGLMLWCLVPFLASAGLATVMVARGRFQLVMLVNVAGALAMTAAMPALVDRFGAAGAVGAIGIGFALPPLIAYAATTPLGWIQGHGQMLRTALLALCACLAYAALAAYNEWLAAIAGLLVIVPGGLMAGVINPEDKAVMRAFFRRGDAQEPPAR